MFISSRRTLAPLSVLLITACGSNAGTAAPDSAEHETIRNAVAEIKADTSATKTNTELLKAGVTTAMTDFAAMKTQVDAVLPGLATDMTVLKGGTEALQTATAALQSDTTAVKSDVTALRASVGTGLQTQLSSVQSSLGALPAGNSFSSMLMAARRYSKTCNPSTDTWLRSAWPGLSDAEIPDACRRDGRWHYLGTMLDVITGTVTFPDDMEVGLGTYSRDLAPVTINGWNKGIRLCLPPIAVGDSAVIDGPAFVRECVSWMDKKFTVTQKLVDQTSTVYVQRDYTNYSAGSETTLPCTAAGGGYASCSNAEAFASYWRIYVRQ